MKRQTKGSATASLVLFASSSLMAGFLGLRQYDRATTTESWVTRSPVYAGQVMTRDALTRGRVKREESGLTDPREMIGKRLSVAKPAGAPLYSNDFAVPVKAPSKTLAQHVPEGRVVFPLPLGDHSTIPLNQLHAGDRLDVLVRGRHGVRTAATDVRLIGVMRPRTGRAAAGHSDKAIPNLLAQSSRSAASSTQGTTLVLAVDPGHVYPLAHIDDRDTISLVLHSAHDVAAGASVSVTPPSSERAVELVSGLNRSTVYVKR